MTAPIAAADLVGAVLERDPALVDVFERHSPHFAKLRNPVMRRTMARLVSVEQAAGIAGVDADVLVRDLNAALGLATDVVPSSGGGSAGASAARGDDDRGAHAPPAHLAEVLLDLREDMRGGKEPFSRIMSAVAALAADEALCLRTIFEPVPLYAVLAKRGLTHATERHAPDDWSVWFWRPERPSPDEAAADDREDTAPASADEQWLDVRGLEPPQPMVRTLTALESLPPGHTLVQVNVRTPQFLLPILAERGFVFTIDASRDDRVLVRIRRGS